MPGAIVWGESLLFSMVASRGAARRGRWESPPRGFFFLKKCLSLAALRNDFVFKESPYSIIVPSTAPAGRDIKSIVQ